eukprot:CAMPEP_0172455254 /NCGR_PEP_ID=MMETSP1065-20121228/11974_1 /TAXON_ID=265537 /ORGANISM="Amphiprora paludosa, Strain CCMP125" /LENGTH=282 /DNA_ID=CAMNT_0013207715 /DNA_START=59 /DNA_END=907 /DNA_ORIENTATION=+
MVYQKSMDPSTPYRSGNLRKSAGMSRPRSSLVEEIWLDHQNLHDQDRPHNWDTGSDVYHHHELDTLDEILLRNGNIHHKFRVLSDEIDDTTDEDDGADTASGKNDSNDGSQEPDDADGGDEGDTGDDDDADEDVNDDADDDDDDGVTGGSSNDNGPPSVPTTPTMPEDGAINPPSLTPDSTGGEEPIAPTTEPLWPFTSPGGLWNLATDWSLEHKTVAAVFLLPLIVLLVCIVRSLYKCRKNIQDRREKQEFDWRNARANMLLGDMEMVATDDETSSEEGFF